MCGIVCILSWSLLNLKKYKKLFASLDRRGPDCSNELKFHVSTNNDVFPTLELFMRGSVLSIRSPKTIQPIIINNNVLLFNGEIYEGLDILAGENDALKLALTLNEKFHPQDNSLCSILKTINGEYALIYYHHSSNSLWFGRDPIGRKSMVINQPTIETFDIKSDLIISSVASTDVDTIWAEIPAGCLYSLNFDKFQNGIRKYSFCTVENFCSTIIINDLSFESYTSKFLYFLKKSIASRVSRMSLSYNTNEVAQIGILFSGGIDCTLIASIASEYLEPGSIVELLNVSFFNGKYSVETAIDRENGRESFKKLAKLYPHIKWIFVEINVSLDDLNGLRKEHIKFIIFPSNTVLDDSLGCSLWFASRGAGTSYFMDGNNVVIDNIKYVSSSKVLLSGLGADELLCGYDQYFHCYKRYGEIGVLKKLKQDIGGLHHRNLGRDDRCCSDHSREVRFPYLDDKFVSFCQQIPVCFKLDMSKPKGVGNKMILRYAALNYGLPKELCFKLKKALQFGSQFVKVSESIGPAKNPSINLITN